MGTLEFLSVMLMVIQMLWSLRLSRILKILQVLEKCGGRIL